METIKRLRTSDASESDMELDEESYMHIMSKYFNISTDGNSQIKDNSNDRDSSSSSSIKRVSAASNGKVLTSCSTKVLTTIKAKVLTTTTAKVLTTTTGNALTTNSAKVLTTTTGKVLTTSSAKVPTTATAKVLTTTTGNALTTSSAKIPTTITGKVLTASTGNVLTTSKAKVLTTTTGNVLNTSKAKVLTTSKAKLSTVTSNIQKNTSSAQVNNIATTSSQVANKPIPDANQVVDTGNLNGDGSAYIIDLTGESPEDELSDSESLLSKDNDFLVVTSEVKPPQSVAFTPLSPQTQAEVRPLLNIFRFCLPKVHIFGIGRLLKPFVLAHVWKIGGDSNCLFRAISYAVYNSEQYHLQVRREICNFIETYDHDLKPFIKMGER